MDRTLCSASLRRLLWRLYDHGGISGRAPKAILLERLWRLDERGADLVDLSLPAWEAEVAELAEKEPYEGAQYVLFRNVAYLSDGDVRRVVITAIRVINEATPDLVSCVESGIVSALATLYGCDRIPAYWRSIVEEHSLSELLTGTSLRNITIYDAKMDRIVRENA